MQLSLGLYRLAVYFIPFCSIYVIQDLNSQKKVHIFTYNTVFLAVGLFFCYLPILSCAWKTAARPQAQNRQHRLGQTDHESRSRGGAGLQSGLHMGRNHGQTKVVYVECPKLQNSQSHVPKISNEITRYAGVQLSLTLPEPTLGWIYLYQLKLAALKVLPV